MSEWGRNMIERELPRTISSLNGLQSTQKEDPGFKEGLIGGGAGTLGGIFDFADAMTGYGRTPGDYLNSIARRNARTKEYTWTDMIPFMSDYYTNSQGFNYGLGQTLGSSLPLMLGGGTVGIGAKGLAALGGGALARSLGSTLARKGAAIGLASAPFEAAAEGGNLYRNMTTANPNGGFDFSDAQGQSAALEAFWKNLPLLAVGNAFEGALLGGVKLPGLSPKVGDGILARAAKGALPPMFANAAQEGATEMLQEGISGNLMGEKVWDIYDSGTWSNPFSEQQKLAGAEAALGAGLMAGGPGAYRGYKSRPQEETRNHEEQLPQIEGRDPFLQIEGAPILQLGAGKGTAPQLEIDDGTEDWNGVEDETKMAANSFGQFLRSNFGINPVITSGKRSKENNAKWEGSPTSWHLKGRAVDLYIGDVSDDQAAQIKQAAESAGWGEVLYHNAGSGKHLHLADYKGGAVGAPAMSDMEQRMWQLAQRSSQKTGIPADWIYAQWYHESDGFSSELAKGNNNFAGVTQSEPNGEENRQPDGGNYYMQFESPEAWEDYYSRFIQKFKGATSAKDYRQWAQNLHDDGYFTDSVENYVAGLERGMKGLSERRRSKEQHTNTSAAAQEVIDWTKGFSDQENYLDFFDEPLPPNVQFMQNYAAQGEAKTDGDQITAEMLPLNAQTPEGQRRQETPQTTAKYKAPPIRQFTTEDIAPPEMPNILQGLNSAPRNLPRYDIPVDFQGDILMNPQETNEQIQSPTIDAARPPHNKTEHSTAEINRMKQEFRSLVLNNEMDKAKEVGNRLFAVEDKVKMLEFMRGIQEEMQYPSEPMQDVEIGSALLSLLNENRLPANDNLRRDLLANKPLAIKSARRKLKAAGVQIPVLPSKAKTYGERLIEAAKNSGVAVNNYLRNDLLKSMPKAIKVAERRLTDAGIDVGALKNDTRDNQRKNGYEENQYANLIEELRRQSEEIVPMTETRDKTPETHKKEQTDIDAKTDRFGSEDEALSEMLKAFGIEEQKKTFNVIDDSDAALEAALSEFNAELSANPVFNPKLMTAAFKIGMIHLQRGLNKLADWSKEMLATSPKLKPFLPSVWDAVQAYPKDLKFDENKMTAVMRYVGTQYDKGIRDKAALKSQLEKMIGKEYAKLIEPAFAGVEKFPTKEEIDHGTNDSADPVATRDRQGAGQDEVGQDDASREPGGRGRQGISKADRQGGQPQRGVPVHEPRANARGTGSDLSIRREKSADTGSIAGTADVSGSLRDGAQGESLLDDGRTGRDIKPPEDRRDNANDLKPKKNQFRAGDLENIRNDLPMLLPEQQEDVVFAERRLLENKKGGVLFTNGTGTGKTFTGLGIIKRFVNQGKSNILIVSPSDKINEDWFNAAKDYFDLTITPLDSVKDKGKGVTITTYANLGTNNELVNRDWDLIVADEAHTLMSSEDGKETKALKHVRALTYHDRGLGERFTCMHSEKLREIKVLSDEIRQLEQDMKKEKGKSKEEIQGRVKKLSDQYDQLYKSYNEKQNAAIKEWGQIKPEDRPKVTFLSATPFPYVADIDYAEGYLFDYEKVERGAYNSPNGQQKFMTDNFGYRMRFGKLTRPESDVDNEVLEIQFHDKLVQDGAMSGRSLIVDKDYDRGFILVDAGIGRKIDDGFKWLMDRKNGNFAQLAEYINKNFSHLKKNYLLEAIKAREAVPLIKDYLASGKKVVVFHNLVKDGSIHPFALEINDIPGEVRKQYREFAAKRPDLIGLNLHNLKSPIETLKDAFGNDLLLYNGDNESIRNRNVDMFNDDDSGKNIILVQSDAGQAGINLHDKTGKYPRVLINLGMPVKPVAAMQIEGRIYRTGQKSNAIFRYLNTGTMFERMAFASKIAGRVGTAENLALGKDARSLRQSFIDAFMETVDSDDWRSRLPGAKGEGTGGKAMDREKRTNLSDFDRAKSYYFAQAKKTSKTKSAEGVDYFATPEPLGYKIVEWANIQKGEKVLEPSAGHGAIARWFGSDTENVMIEPSEKLASVAQMSARGNVIRQRFEDYHIGNKFNAIVMNPPFGRGGKTAIEHIAKAFGHLRDGGRIVAIVPDGPSTQKYFDKWYYGDENAPDKAGREGKKDAVLVKEVLLPSVTFERAGTKVNCKVLVIDKQATKEGRGTVYEGGTVDLRDAETIKEFFDRVEHISIPERTKIGAEKEGDESVTSEAQANSNFDADIFSHTKTGEQIPRAAFKQFVDDYKSVSSLAKRHGGYYSRIAKGFLFKDNPEGRDAFVKEADALLNGRDIRMSAESSISFDDALNRMEFIADDQLTRQERAIKEMGRQLGVPVVFYDIADLSELRGFHASGVSFINRRANMPLNWVFWHESFHWLKQNNPSIYRDMVNYIAGKDGFTQKQIDAYKEQTGRADLSNEAAIEEMLADFMPQVSRRVGLMKQLAKENPTLAERFVAWVRDMLDRFRAAFSAVGLSVEQKYGMTEAFLNLARDMIGPDGKRLFDVRRGQVYLRRNGRPAKSALSADSAVAYSSGKEMQEAIDKRVNLEDNLTKEEEAYLEEFAKGVVEKIEKDGEQILKRFSPADGLEALREKFVSESAMKNRNKWLGVYEKAPNSNFAIIKLGEAARVLWLERKEILRNDQILRGLERLLTNANERGTYSGIIERMQGYRLSTDVQSSSGGHRFDGVRNGSHQSSSRVDLKTPAEFEPQERGGHLAAYKEALQKYEALQKKKKAAQEAYDKEHSKEGAFSMPENGLKYSIGLDSLFQHAVANLAKKLGLKSTPRANVQVDTMRRGDTLGILDMWVRSPSEIAKKHPVFKPFFDYAATAVEKQERLRNRYSQEMKKIAKLLKDPKDLEACSQVLLEGDRIQKEYTARELKAAGLADNAIRAYMSIRRNMKETYELINDARQQIRKHSEHMSGAQLEALKQNKFASVLESRKVGDDQFLVTYKSPKTWRKSDVAVTEEALEEMRANENIQIVKDVDAGGGLHRISYIEQAAPLTNRTGYIPHFFHEYFIMTKTATGKQIPGKGKDKGKMIPEYKYEVVTSGKTLADAVEIANELADKNKNVQYVIRQKGFGFDGKEREIAAVVGDHEFDAMSRRVAEHTDMSVKDAKEFLKETAGVGLQGRHRFYGNALHRKGAKGFEEDLLWVLGHHFNTASRYVAMEDFKPQAIGLFERKFGRFNDDYSGNSNAQYVKDYINDVNGKPTAIENKLNETIKNNPYFQHVLGDYFGDRPALQISSGISGTMAKAKLGFLNASSALLNLTQFLNIVGRLDSYEYATEGFKRAFHPTEADQRIIDASGALDNINIAADAGGYTQSRAAGFGGAKGKLRFAFKNLNALMDKGMFFFSAIDGLMRKAAVLGAYHQAIKEKGMNPKEAMAYAKDVNREANFDYGAHDAPNIIRRGSVLTQNALQFQKYPIKQLEFMHNILCNGSKKQLYTFWLPFFLIAGLGQFPFADWMDKIIETLTGGKIKPKVDGKKMLMEFAGSSKEARLLADIAMYGGMSVVGADISARAGMGDIFGSLSMVGPAGSTVSGMVRQAANGNPIETFKAFSPGLGNILQAVAGEARTTRHRVGTTYEGWDRVLKAAGFRTMDEAVASDLRTIALTEQQRKQKREQAAIDAYIEDPTTENYRRLKELKITAKRVQNERKKKKMNNRERTIDNMSNAVREDLSGVIDYAK